MRDTDGAPSPATSSSFTIIVSFVVCSLVLGCVMNCYSSARRDEAIFVAAACADSKVGPPATAGTDAWRTAFISCLPADWP